MLRPNALKALRAAWGMAALALASSFIQAGTAAAGRAEDLRPGPSASSNATRRAAIPVDQAARNLVEKVEPEYPSAARQKGISGVVRLRAGVNRRGEVSRVVVRSGHPLLAKAATQAVKKWKYKPFVRNDGPGDVVVDVEVAFRLEARGAAGTEYERYAEAREAGTRALMMGDYPTAERALQEAARLRESLAGSNDPELASVLRALGQAYLDQENFPEAERAFERRLGILRNQKNPREAETGEAYGDLARAFHAGGWYEGAAANYQDAVAIFEKQLASARGNYGRETRWARTLADALRRLAALYQNEGKFAAALPVLSRRLEILEQHRMEEDAVVAEALTNLAGVHLALGDLRKAEALCRRALPLVESMRDGEEGQEAHARQLATVLLALAVVYHRQRDYGRAELYYQRALVAGEHASTREEIVATLRGYAGVLRATGREKEATLLLGRAWQLEAGPSRP